MDLPNQHWIPDGEIGLVATLEKFNQAMLAIDAGDYSAKIFSAFLTLARRYDLYTKSGNDAMGEEGLRFRNLLCSSLTSEEKETFLMLDATRCLLLAPPVFDEGEMNRIRKMGEGIKRDMHNNPFKLFNEFKINCRKFKPGDDPERPFELLCGVLYLIGKNIQKIGRIPIEDIRKKARDARVSSISGSVFSNLVDFYFFGMGSYRIVTHGYLEDPSSVFGADTAYVDAQLVSEFSNAGDSDSFVFITEVPPSAVKVAVLPRPFDIRACDHAVERAKGAKYRRQIVPVMVNDVMMMAFIYGDGMAD